MKCIPGTGRFYRKPLPSVEEGGTRFGIQPVGVNTLSKYVQSMSPDAKINLQGRRLTNHSGKVMCTTTLYEDGMFDKQTITSRTGHRSVAVLTYKRPSDELVIICFRHSAITSCTDDRRRNGCRKTKPKKPDGIRCGGKAIFFCTFVFHKGWYVIYFKV